MEWKNYLRIVLIIFLLYMLYWLGLPLQYVVLLGVIYAAMFFLRGNVYPKIEHMISAKFPRFHTLPNWVKRAIIIIMFIVVYAIIKQLFYAALMLGGIDVQQDINDVFSSYGKK